MKDIDNMQKKYRNKSQRRHILARYKCLQWEDGEQVWNVLNTENKQTKEPVIIADQTSEAWEMFGIESFQWKSYLLVIDHQWDGFTARNSSQ